MILFYISVTYYGNLTLKKKRFYIALTLKLPVWLINSAIFTHKLTAKKTPVKIDVNSN